MTEMMYYNINDGYPEAIVRGYRRSLLTSGQYSNLTQSETLEDIKLQLSATDYGNFLQNEPPPLTTGVIADKLTERLVAEFNYLRKNSVKPLGKFLEYITYQYFIDNVILLISGTLHDRTASELLHKAHPLGVFESMPALSVASNVQELYNIVLVETPLAEYFRGCLTGHDLDEMNIEVIRNTLHKAYLEDFYRFCTEELGGSTGKVMKELLEFEADRRIINITINSFGTELSKEDRLRLYPRCGKLSRESPSKLAAMNDIEAVKAVCDQHGEYRHLFENMSRSDRTLEDRFFEHEVRLNLLSFHQQFHYGIYYSWLKLKEQEIRNVVWISECIQQQQKERIGDYVPTL